MTEIELLTEINDNLSAIRFCTGILCALVGLAFSIWIWRLKP